MMIKQYGVAESATNLEIFIRPYLMMGNVAITLGDPDGAQKAIQILTKIIHDLYGQESELEIQLMLLLMSYELFWVGLAQQ